MSFADDFGHNIPPDDWPGGSGYPSKRYRSRSIDYNSRGSMMLTKKYLDISYETDKAYLCNFPQGKAWLPKSKIHLNKTESVVRVPTWLWDRVNFIKD